MEDRRWRMEDRRFTKICFKKISSPHRLLKKIKVAKTEKTLKRVQGDKLGFFDRLFNLQSYIFNLSF